MNHHNVIKETKRLIKSFKSNLHKPIHHITHTIRKTTQAQNTAQPILCLLFTTIKRQQPSKPATHGAFWLLSRNNNEEEPFFIVKLHGKEKEGRREGQS